MAGAVLLVRLGRSPRPRACAACARGTCPSGLPSTPAGGDGGRRTWDERRGTRDENSPWHLPRAV